MVQGIQKSLKVCAVDVSMVFLASQLVAVPNQDLRKSAAVPKQAICQAEAPGYGGGLENEEMILAMAVAGPGTETWKCVADKEILLQIAMAEAEGEGVGGKAHVMRVVLNRVEDERFPGTVEGVVFQEGQFTPVDEGGRYWRAQPDAECYEAYELVSQGWDESEGALYFCAERCSRWMEENTEYLYTYGGHSFYK